MDRVVFVSVNPSDLFAILVLLAILEYILRSNPCRNPPLLNECVYVFVFIHQNNINQCVYHWSGLLMPILYCVLARFCSLCKKQMMRASRAPFIQHFVPD